MTDYEAQLLAHLRALPAPTRAWARETLRRLVNEMPALSRRHASGEVESVRQANRERDRRALLEAIDSISDETQS